MGGLLVVHLARLVAIGRGPNHAPVGGVLLELPDRQVGHREGCHRLLLLLVVGHDPRLEHGQLSPEVGQLLLLALRAVEHIDVESGRDSCRVSARLEKITETMKRLIGRGLNDLLDHALDDADAGVVKGSLVA